MPFSTCFRSHIHLYAFPTRRSSDLSYLPGGQKNKTTDGPLLSSHQCRIFSMTLLSFPNCFPLFSTLTPTNFHPYKSFQGWCEILPGDRKSTRLNSRHVSRLYAVLYLLPLPHTSIRLPYTTLFRSLLFARWSEK